jgi:CheY-like chemotaxis protein
MIIDDKKYEQLFLNILTNAIKYTFEGFIDVTIECKDSILTTTIVDTGIGIKEEVLSNIFKIFNNPEKKLFDGTTGIGIGLSISKKLTNLMNGDICVTSIVNKGTKVIFTVKYKSVNFQNFAPSSSNYNFASPSATPACNLLQKHILIVDDTVFNVYALKKMLNSISINSIYEAYNGKQAIEIFKEKREQISVIFMDINMPGMNGFEVATEINSLIAKNNYPRVQIVALSAQKDDDYLRKALNSGMCKYRTLVNSN